MVAKPIPDGFHTATPYLVVKGAARAIDFYKKAFGAQELSRHTCGQTQLVLNAKIKIGNSIIMLNDEFPDFGCVGPAEGTNSPVTIHLYVENVNAAFDRAVKAGATPTMPVSDQFWGDRYGQLKDPFGHSWSIATHVEDVSDSEMADRARAAMAEMGRQ